MTIPNLMHNIKTKELESKFKKANSTVAQIARYMQNDDDSFDYSDHIRGQFNNIIIKYLPGAIYCGWSGNWANDPGKNIKGCYLPQPSTPNNQKYKTFNNAGYAHYDIIDDGIYILKDGSYLYLENNVNNIFVSIDLNGIQNAPNRWGYDIFMW